MLGYLKRGETYRRHGDLAAAVRDLRKASVLDRTATRPLEQLGDVHFAQGQFARAADRYQAYLRLDDRSPRLLYKRALALYAHGNAAAAVPPLRQAVRLNDRFAEGYYLLGVCLRAQRQQPEALWALQRAVRLAPGLMPARETLADLFNDLNRQSDRIEQLEALAALEPDRTERYVALAMARAETGPHEHGRARARPRGGAASGRHARLHGARDRVAPDAEGQGDPAALARALDATQHDHRRTVNPRPQTCCCTAALSFCRGIAAGALPVLRAATAQLPMDPRAYETLATAAERADRLAEAKDALEQLRTLARDERTEAATSAPASPRSRSA